MKTLEELRIISDLAGNAFGKAVSDARDINVDGGTACDALKAALDVKEASNNARAASVNYMKALKDSKK
jgi:hypothetical protein